MGDLGTSFGRRLTPVLTLLGATLVALALVTGCSSDGQGSSAAPTSSSSTTPLGCPADLPRLPLQTDEAHLECTERALIGLVCDLNPDALTQVGAGGTKLVRQVRYSAANPRNIANVTYDELNSSNYLINLGCTVPGGGVATKKGNVQLSYADWGVIASPGTSLPEALQPQNLARPRPSSVQPPPTPSESYAPVPNVPDNPGFADCESRAFDVFTRFANGQLTLAQARQQLPAGVPPASLTRSLEGVKRYESEGISHADAVTEAGGAVGQACPR